MIHFFKWNGDEWVEQVAIHRDGVQPEVLVQALAGDWCYFAW